MKLLSYLNNTPCRPRRVLCVSKLSSLEFIKSRNPNLNEDQILSRLRDQGRDSQGILNEHQLQIACEQKLAEVLKKLDISFHVTKRYHNEALFALYKNGSNTNDLNVTTFMTTRVKLRTIKPCSDYNLTNLNVSGQNRNLKSPKTAQKYPKRMGDAIKYVKWADLVIPIGGDGTFLLATKLITDNTKPVFGINPSVPTRSNIFTLPPKYTTNIESIFEKLHSGDYTLLMRSRIRTVMNGEGLYKRPFHIHEKSRTQGERRAEALVRSTERKMADSLQPRQRVLPWLALNEIFMGEFLAARPISLIVQVEGQREYRFRSSGICICTGSGSQSWYRSINVQSTDTVQRIVEMATGKKLSSEDAKELLYKYHQKLLYTPDDLRMIYIIREIYYNSHENELNDCPERQVCSQVTVKSRGFDAGLIIDGSISLPFNDGTLASFEIRPEYSLRNIVLP
ncbi:NAD kinase 2, mitochondrial [Calliopsis andreniformis]|uniref:NAD kinase 2, mitochondrial n=1 Tax=Calliopsis andreniformis TaxID=337506 RepID=UPI003FCC9F7A